VVLRVRLLRGFQELALAPVDDVALVESRAGRRFERDSAGLAALPGPDKVRHVQRAPRRAMDQGDDVADAADDIVRREKFAHGGMRGLETGDHLARLHLLQELLQVPVKYDKIVFHDHTVLQSSMERYIPLSAYPAEEMVPGRGAFPGCNDRGSDRTEQSQLMGISGDCRGKQMDRSKCEIRDQGEKHGHNEPGPRSNPNSLEIIRPPFRDSFLQFARRRATRVKTPDIIRTSGA